MALSGLLVTIFALLHIIHCAKIHAIQLQKCTKQFTRKEYRDMTKMEWNNFRSTLLQLQNLPSPDGTTNHSEWDYWTKIHLDYMRSAHGSARFFPWHRAYVLALERRLQQINTNVVIPFWDWTFDWKQPLSSPIFSRDYGLDVKINIGDCRYRRMHFRKHCLLRQYNPKTFASYYSPRNVSTVISSETDYDSFRELIEMVPHAIVHVTLGGDMASMSSPNDPIFWLHHSMIDFIWWIWQRAHPSKANDYKGKITEVLYPFGITVGQVLNTTSLCYNYRPFSQNLRLIPSITKMGSTKDVDTWNKNENWLEMNGLDRGKRRKSIDRFQ